jgi:NADP-dependent 3-hydroxy acid dehydrogenase YdfG
LKKGANICIIARNTEQLREAAETLKHEKLFEEQIIEIISADVTNFQNVKAAVEKIEIKYGKIDALFSCAGTKLVRLLNIA